jgi:ubiquinone/menaquinone biosynthesis C-methylase UbiE
MNDAADRLERTYGRYQRSRRRRRAWAADNPGNRAIRAELLELFHSEVGDRLAAGQLLDVGCGAGWLLIEVARSGVAQERLHGVELIESRIAAARRALPCADVRRADARHLPFESGAFDVVTMFTVLSSLPDARSVQNALGEARRVLTPGGVLLVYEPRRPNPLNRATRVVSPRQLDASLGSGWREIPLTVVPVVARRLGPLTEWLYPRLRRVQPLLTHRLVALQAEEPLAQPSERPQKGGPASRH